MRKRLKVRVGCGVLAAALVGGLSVGEAQATDLSDRPPGAVSSAEGGPEGCGPIGNLRDVFEDVATAAGVSPEELQAALASGQSVAQVAQANGVEPATVVDAALADLEAHVAAKVADGRLTQAQADDLLARAEDKVTQVINTALPVNGPKPGDGGGGPGGGDDGGGSDSPLPTIAEVFADVATAAGVTPEDLKAALADGRTIVEVAAANGVDQQALVDAATADLRAALAEKVADGRLTQAQADAWTATAGAVVSRVINTPLARPKPVDPDPIVPPPTDPSADPSVDPAPTDSVDDDDDGRPSRAEREAAKRARWEAYLNALREAAREKAVRWEQWRQWQEQARDGRRGDGRQSVKAGGWSRGDDDGHRARGGDRRAGDHGTSGARGGGRGGKGGRSR